MNDFTFNLLKVVVSLATVLITTQLIPLIRLKIADSKYEKLLEMVEIAVRAAEQTIGSGQGKLKKEEVITFVTNWMVNHGVSITQDQLEQLIEAAVYQLKNE